MIHPEPYVADAAEPRLAPRLARWRPLVAALAVLVIVAAGVYLVFGAGAQQDPALEVPTDGSPPAGSLGAGATSDPLRSAGDQEIIRRPPGDHQF